MEQNREAYMAKYNEKTHFYGRIGLWIGIILLLAAPFLMGISLDAMPDMSAFMKGLAQIPIIYIPSCIVEFLIYMPMLGAGGSYLSFVTGNISNLKLPCAINALEQNAVSVNTEEGEIISTIAIATSSIVTTIIIIIGVICIVPLTPILEAPVLEPAFAQMLPSLFGGLGVAFVSKNWKIAVAPIALMLVLFFFVPYLNAGLVGIMVPVGVLFALATSRLMYNKGLLGERGSACAHEEDAA